MTLFLVGFFFKVWILDPKDFWPNFLFLVFIIFGSGLITELTYEPLRKIYIRKFR